MFGRGISLFRLFGFEVRLDWSWLILAVLLTWSLATGVFPSYYRGLSTATYWWMGVTGALGLFLSIVLHELGHSLAARRFGIPMRGITLFIFGGVAEMGGPPPSAKSEFFMAIAGPIVSVLLVGLFFGIHWLGEVAGWPTALTGVFAYLTWINLLVVAFNLVPAFPLDGGRVLRSVLWGWKRNLSWATRIAAAVGSGFAFLLIFWGIFSFATGNFIGGLWWVLIGLFLRSAAQVSYQQVLVRQVLSGEPVHRFMTSSPVTVPPSLPVQQLVDQYIYRYPYKLFPVVDNERLVGCLTIDAVKQIPKTEWNAHTAGELAAACSPENTIGPDTDAVKAIATMNRTHASRLMVVDQDRLLGVIAFKDLMEFLGRKMELEPAGTL